MIKEVKSNGNHTFKIEIWESNKGQYLGMCAWGLWIAVPELETYYKLDGSHRYYPLSPDNAERVAYGALDRALNGGYSIAIENEVGI